MRGRDPALTQRAYKLEIVSARNESHRPRERELKEVGLDGYHVESVFYFFVFFLSYAAACFIAGEPYDFLKLEHPANVPLTNSLRLSISPLSRLNKRKVFSF